MSELLKSLRTPEGELALAEVLYGDGAWEIAKSMSEEKRHRTEAKVALATNVLGITAGGAALGSELKRLPQTLRGKKLPTGVVAVPKPVAEVKGLRKIATPKRVAAAMIGLQAVNLGGDLVANRVLARSAKKKQPVTKSIKSEDLRTAKGKLIRTGVNTTFKAVEKAPDLAVKVKSEVTKNLDVLWTGEISKMDTDKRQVFGWASIVELNGQPVVDLQGDYMTVEEIEKAAYNYVLNSRKGGNQHQKSDDGGPKHVSDMIESFLVTPEKKEQMGLPADTPVGWWVGFQVNDDDTWAEVKSGKKKEFSIHGSGVRKEKVLD